MKRWVIRILGGVLVIVVVALLVLYIGSNRVINKRYTFREYAVNVPTDSVSIAQGYHFARTRCFGCHGDSLQGTVLFDQPMIARLIAPNVPKKLATLTNAEFAGFMHYAVRKDGTSSFVMPTPNLYHISDQDLGALIAYIRSVPVPDNRLPGTTYGPMGRFGAMIGQFKTAVASYDTTTERVGQDPAWSTTRRGEYVARTICIECHGEKLTGDPSGPTPSLSGAIGYAPEEFTKLLRTGTPRDTATKLTLMAEVAKGVLTHLSDEEIAALYGYLKELPATGVAR